MELRLTRYRATDGKAQTVVQTKTAEELEDLVLSLLERVAWRAEYAVERAEVRLPSAAQCRFPYRALRAGQEELIKTCYRAIRQGKRLFAEAPTGIGKTISTLYPAARALGEGHCDRIFYLTAKGSTRREAFRAAQELYAAGGRLRTLILTAREQLCPNREAHTDPAGITAHCDPCHCPRAVRFYDRVPVALCDLLVRHNGFSRSVIEQAAEDYGICPYELQLELAEFCDCIICDYNYIFDPLVYLRRFLAEEMPEERFVLLVDEAHNLSDRACAMYSAELSLEAAEAAWQALMPARTEPNEDGTQALPALVGAPEGIEALGGLIAALRGCRALCREHEEIDAAGTRHGYYVAHSPLLRLTEAAEHCREWLTGVAAQGDPCVLGLLSALKRFAVIAELYDSHFLTFIERHGHAVTARLVCLDPSQVLDRVLSRVRSAIFFSATLTPPDYFANVLGGGKGAMRLALSSPFDPTHLCLAAVTGVSTRYGDREGSAKRIAACIAATVSGRRGNYMVFFPSYAYLGRVLAQFRSRYPAVEVIEQEPGMGAQGRERFLGSFVDDGRLRVGFCVLGGSFSEGIDLPGGRLIGVVVVGVGLPGLSSERNILREYYDENGESGYDYAYTYPGFNRVLQAVGRVIRREEDHGVAVLIDDRWCEDRLRRLFPPHWQGILYAGTPAELANIVTEYWRKENT